MTSLNEHKTLIAAASSKLALTIATENQYLQSFPYNSWDMVY